MAPESKDTQFEYIDDDEREIVASLEADEWISVADADTGKAEATEIARSTMRKDRRMNVRISERDMRNLKIRAAEEGIPYQTLVTMVLHKYVTGQLTETR
jgi:predicted DNA binding CopG/RHH family protein